MNEQKTVKTLNDKENMNDIRAEIKNMMRDFYKAKSVVSIDNDDLEPFFTAENLVAFDHQAPATNPQGMERICDVTKQELQRLMQTRKVERVLFLLFQSAQHELQITELEGFSKMGLAEDVPVSWGLGTQEKESVRMVTLVSASDIFSGCDNKVYDYFKDIPFVKKLAEDGLITKTPIDEKRYKKPQSDNSFSLKSEDGKEFETLKEVFGLTEDNYGSFAQATKGQPCERKRILTVHSSALLALLFFLSVSETNPLKWGKYTFTDVRFEEKNVCLKDTAGREHKSNIDVKLIGKDDSGKDMILYLESKLSEYLKSGKKSGISKEYAGEVFDKGNLPKGLEFREEDGYLALTTEKGKCAHYCEGIKQMMCHFIGISGRKETQGKETLLGTILFDLSSIDKEAFERYGGDYSQLAKKLNNLGKGVKMIEAPLTYQQLYKEAKSEGFKLSPKVAEYYGLEEE